MSTAAEAGTATGTPTQARSRGTQARGVATPLVRERVDFLVGLVGGADLARWLEVSRSQPTRWRSGAEQPSARAARALVDLDHVVTRALMLWVPRVAVDWLTSSNAYLDGARPLDVLRTRGSAEVIDALDAADAGVYA